jgi:glutamate carboxypeptidase
MIDPIVAYLQSRLDLYLAELESVVSLDSYSYDRDDVNRVVDWLEARLRKLGFQVSREQQEHTGDNLIASRAGKGAGRVMLLGHSDTVFPRGTTAQRPMSFQGDKILGPGTCDMKGGWLAGIYAVEALDAIGFDAYEQISFLIVSDEEVDERYSIPLIKSTSRGNHAVLTLEAARANGDIVVARKGVRSYTAEAHGHAAHSGVEPEKGRNAILALAHQIIALERLNDPANGITVNVGVVEGGRLRNIVPDYARLRFEARAFTQPDLDRITTEIFKLFESSAVPGVNFDVTYEQIFPPMPRTPEVAALEAVTQRIANELGFEVKGARTGGAADAAFAAAEGIPALDGLGPVGGLDHGPDEYILKSSIVPRTALLAKLIQAIAEKSGKVDSL